MALEPIWVLQVLAGLGMFLGHGLYKITHVGKTMKNFSKMGYGKITGLFAALVEGVGSILLIVGVYPRIMAGLLGLMMLGAMIHHWKNKDSFKGGWEAPYLYFIAMIVIVLAGTGFLTV